MDITDDELNKLGITPDRTTVTVLFQAFVIEQTLRGGTRLLNVASNSINITVISPSEIPVPVTLQEKMRAFINDPSNPIGDRNAVSQLLEEFGRNKISFESMENTFLFIG